MSNVKAGDLAKFLDGVVPPEFKGVHCLVLRQYPRDTIEKEMGLRSIAMHFGPGIVWEIELLEHVVIRGGSYFFIQSNEMPPGWVCGALDRFLQRIEPPADTQAVFGHEPLPGERWIEQQQLPETERWNKETES